MFTDLEGFTSLAHSDETEALRLLEAQEKLVHPVLAAHHGRKIKSMGDGLLIEFPNARDAVEGAVELQRSVHEHNSEDRTRPLRIRIGIHVGDVEHRGTDILGDAVNIASRIEPLAEPGGICLSAQVFDQVRTKLPYNFDRLSARTLKGIEEPIEVYRVVLPWRTPTSERPSPGVTRLAVLPFANISPDPNDEYFADGLTEELITTLSQLRGVDVIARTSVFPYKSTSKPLAQVGAELGVTSVLEGSVRKAGNRLRITAQLVDVSSQGHIWASTYDRALDDIFAVQTEVASSVARSLSQEVLRSSSEGEPRNVDAYTLYLRAMKLYHEETQSDVGEAVTLLEQSVELDPSFGRAYAGLALARAWLAEYGGVAWSNVAEKALPAARRAVQLSPRSAETHEALARVHLLQDDFESAIQEIRAAIRLNPNSSQAYRSLAVLRCQPESGEECLSAFRRSYELDPLSVTGAAEFAWVLQLLGHDQEALEVLGRISRVRPSDPEVIDAFAEYYLLRGEWSRATSVLETGLREHPHYVPLLAERARLLALTGHSEEARNALQEIEREAGESAYLSSQLFVLSALNDLDGAFSALMRLADGHTWPYVVLIHPSFARLRQDPRYLDFRTKVRLPG